MKTNKILKYIICIFLLEPTIFIKFKITNYIYIIFAVIIFAYLIYVYVKKKEKIDYFFIILILYRVLIIIPTIVNSGDILKVGYISIIMIDIFLFFKINIKNSNYEIVHILSNIFIFYLLVNLVTIIKFDNGIIENLYFLGIRTRFTDYAFPGMLLTVMDYKLNNVNRFQTVLKIIIILLNIIIPKVSTAYVGLALFIILAFTLKKIRNIKILNYNVFITLALVLNISIVFFRIQNIFSFIIVDLLGKNLTLSGRTFIWDASYEYLKENLLLGNGLNNLNGNFIYFHGWWQAHNQFLQQLYESGIFGTILLIIALYYTGKNINKSVNKNIYISFMFAFCIMMITEIYAYYVTFYLSIILIYLVSKEERTKNEKDWNNNISSSP